MIPREAIDAKEKNKAYAQVLLKSLTATPEELEAIKKKLRLNPTPREVIYREAAGKLYRFTPVKKKLHPVPLLIVPSLILKYYIMDLLKEHSLIESLVKQGVDVYLLDWGTPGPEYGHLTFDYYIDTFLRRAVRKVSRETGQEKINLLGQCLGGTLAAIFTSLYPDKVNRLVTLTTPVDFRDAGVLALWTNPETFDVDKVVDSFGDLVPAEFIHSCFQFLDLKATVERYKKLYNNVLDEYFLHYYQAMDTWVNDKIPFPGEVFRKFIKGLYQENQLAKGKFPINGRLANLANITCPVQNIIARHDHVFPPKAAEAIDHLVGGPVESHTIDAGHVTLVALFPQRMETYELMGEFLTRREKEKKAPARTSSRTKESAGCGKTRGKCRKTSEKTKKT